MNNTVNIRKCQIDDLELIVKMRMEFLKEAGHVKEDEDPNDLHEEIHNYVILHLNQDFHFWIGELESEVVSTGAVSIWDKLPVRAEKGNGYKIGYFSNMYTRLAFRRMGIASELMKQMLQFLRSEGVQKAMLHALEDGKGMYRKFGFDLNESCMEMQL